MRPVSIFAGVALAVAVGAAAAQSTSFFNLNTSISKSQAPIATVCHPDGTTVACPADTKSQLHYLRGAGTVYLGIGPVTSSNGLPLTGDNRQAWDVAGGIVRCAAAPDAGVTLYTTCGRGP